MNGAAAKATRRQLRRAMGDSALNVVSSHEHGLRSLQMRVATLEQHDAGTRLMALEGIGAIHRTRLDAHRDILMRGFFGRVKWLLSGK